MNAEMPSVPKFKSSRSPDALTSFAVRYAPGISQVMLGA